MIVPNSKHGTKEGLYSLEMPLILQVQCVLQERYVVRILIYVQQHLGQGANQAFEDIYHLILSFVKHNPDASAVLSTAALSTIFSAYEAVRLPRSSELVKGARAMGNTRVVHGVDECKARNEKVRLGWTDREAMINAYDRLLDGPFKGASQI